MSTDFTYASATVQTVTHALHFLSLTAVTLQAISRSSPFFNVALTDPRGFTASYTASRLQYSPMRAEGCQASVQKEIASFMRVAQHGRVCRAIQPCGIDKTKPAAASSTKNAIKTSRSSTARVTV
jgi:hypothetical protein